MKTLKKILKVLGLLLCIALIGWFLLPLKRSTFNIGSIFGIAVALFAAFLLLFYKKLADKGGKLKVLMRTLTVVFLVGIAWCTYLTVLMFSFGTAEIPKDTDIMVLGAQIYSEDHVSISLKGRLVAAEKYLEENPEAAVFVTGGQGSNEPCPEAHAERKYLLKQGFSEDRIIVEDKSTTTRQNMENSLAIAKEHGIEPSFGIVTQSFHMFRSLKLAEEVGITAYPVVAETDKYLFPSYYGRELLSLTKWHLEQIVR